MCRSFDVRRIPVADVERRCDVERETEKRRRQIRRTRVWLNKLTVVTSTVIPAVMARKELKQTQTNALRALREWASSASGHARLKRAARASAIKRQHVADAVRISTEHLRARVTF
jgi:hypothetical protein